MRPDEQRSETKLPEINGLWASAWRHAHTDTRCHGYQQQVTATNPLIIQPPTH